MASAFIAIEWGTAQLRARLLSADGGIIDQASETVRLADLDHDGKVARLRAIRTRWPSAAGAMWLAGMIGSPLGIENVVQLPCPATPSDIACHARRIDLGGIRAAILPGLSCVSRFGDPDVLRGEEVGAAALIGSPEVEDALLVSVPGMHGKWIELSATGVERFHTAMTVELHHALAQNSILAPLMAAPPVVGEAFYQGVKAAAHGGGLARLLFSARSRTLAGQFDEDSASAFLWGVLIGADVAENVSLLRTGRPCFIVGAVETATLFHAAIVALGGRAELADNDRLSAQGFARLRRAAGGEE